MDRILKIIHKDSVARDTCFLIFFFLIYRERESDIVFTLNFKNLIISDSLQGHAPFIYSTLVKSRVWMRKFFDVRSAASRC